MSSRLLIVDQSLKGFEGHHYDYSRSVIEAARVIGVDTSLACHQDFPAESLGGAPIVGRFSAGWSDARRSVVASASHSLLTKMPTSLRRSLLSFAAHKPLTVADTRSDPRFAHHLLKILTDMRMEESDHVFIHTLGASEFLGLADVLTEFTRLKPRLNVLLRYDGTESFRNVFYKLQKTDAKLSFWTDTNQLAAHYLELGCPTIGVLPIPSGFSTIPDRPPRKNAPLTLAYLGGARSDKGFHLLPDLVDALKDEFLATGRIRFLIQATYGISREEALMARAHARLVSFPDEWVHLIETPPDANAFRKALLATDLLLLPYDREIYRRRSSGLLVQAMIAGIPTIIPHGTWLATEAPEGAYVTFGAKLTQSDTVRGAISNYEDLLQAGRGASKQAYVRHNTADLLEYLLHSRQLAR